MKLGFSSPALRTQNVISNAKSSCVLDVENWRRLHTKASHWSDEFIA